MFKFIKTHFFGNATTFVGNAADLTMEDDGSALSYHDGVTPGGLPVGPPIAGPLTPLAGGDPNGTPLIYGYNLVNCAVADYDSVLLPPAVAGTMVTIIVNPNSGDSTIVVGVWPQGNDTINGLGGDFLYYAPNPLANAESPPRLFGTTPCICVCVVAGQWVSNFEFG